MTCRKCSNFNECSDRLGTTKFYDNVVADDAVELHCPLFIEGKPSDAIRIKKLETDLTEARKFLSEAKERNADLLEENRKLKIKLRKTRERYGYQDRKASV